MDRKQWVAGAAGTLTLLGPARWVTEALGSSTYSRHEDHAMTVVMVVFVGASFLLARYLTSVTRRTPVRPVRYGIPALTTVAAGLALWGWTNPAVYAEVSVAGGADPKATNSKGQTAGNLAAKRGHAVVAQQLGATVPVALPVGGAAAPAAVPGAPAAAPAAPAPE